jgi:peroxiredoxin
VAACCARAVASAYHYRESRSGDESRNVRDLAGSKIESGIGERSNQEIVMKKSLWYVSVAAFTVVSLSLPLAATGQDKQAPDKDGAAAGLKIGEAAPEFELKGVDGKTYKLSDYKDKVVVLDWVNRECPYYVKAIPRVKELGSKWAGKGVVFLAIDSAASHTKSEPEAEFHKKEGLPHVTILMDTDGKVGKKYNARRTPELYVINKGKLAYMGALDDSKGGDAKTDTRKYVDEALTAVMDGKEPAMTKTDAWGCTVKYAK